MKSTHRWPRKYDASIQHTFWILPIFNVLKDIKGFKVFLAKHSQAESREVLIGYKHLVKWVLRDYLLFDFELDSFLGLTMDRAAHRAFWVGPPRIPVEKIPTTSEKAVAVRNLNEAYKEVYGSQDFASLADNMAKLDQKFFGPLSNIFDKHVGTYKKRPQHPDKYSLLVGFGLTEFWDKAQNVDRIAHLDFLGKETDPRVEKERRKLEYYFLGYKLGVAYMWAALRREEANEAIARVFESKTWEELSTACNSMRDEIGELMAEAGENFMLRKIFVRQSKPDKRLLAEILKPPQVRDPSQDERLDEMLLWYDNVEVIDSARSKLFSGGPTFRSLLHGEVLNRRLHGAREKLLVIRFSHPDRPIWFSYAILMVRTGAISDSSGWLIFLEVGGDYAGQGGLEYHLTENMLQQLKKWVQVNEIEIELRSLWKFYLNKISKAAENPLDSVSGTELMRVRLNQFERLNPLIMGRMLEFITKSFYEVNYDKVHLRFKDTNVMPQSKEIDVLAIKKDTEVVVAECKTSIPVSDLDDLIKTINFKVDCVRKSPDINGISKIRKVFVSTLRGMSEVRSLETVMRKLSEANIDLLVLEEDIIPNLPNSFNQEELLSIFRLNQFEDLQE